MNNLPALLHALRTPKLHPPTHTKALHRHWPEEALGLLKVLGSRTQGPVEAGLALRMDRKANLLAEAHQQSIDLTPQPPVRVRDRSVWKWAGPLPPPASSSYTVPG